MDTITTRTRERGLPVRSSEVRRRSTMASNKEEGWSIESGVFDDIELGRMVSHLNAAAQSAGDLRSMTSRVFGLHRLAWGLHDSSLGLASGLAIL